MPMPVRRAARWRRSWLRILALLLALTSAAAAPAEIRIRDDRGVELRLAAAPARIVSLLPSLTETLCALGGCQRLVGIDRYVDWPPELQGLPRLGGLDDTSPEAVVALRPDVVLMARSARLADRLEALGLRVLAFDSDHHADVERSMVALATLLAAPEHGRQAWQRVQDGMDAAAARLPPAWRGRRAYFEIGGGPHAAGEASFVGQTLAWLGLVNIVPAGLGPFPALNPEFVLRAQPELVLAERDEVDAMPSRPGWGALAALRDGRACGFDRRTYELLIRPGPRLGEAAARIVDCIAALPPPATTAAVAAGAGRRSGEEPPR
jgi:iron complex transport system substrate-binding protein